MKVRSECDVIGTAPSATLNLPLWRENVVEPGGRTFVPALDRQRLGRQHARIVALMRDAHWRTLAAIERNTRDPQASISARLRDLRKLQYGHFVVERRRTATPGVFEYRVRSHP